MTLELSTLMGGWGWFTFFSGGVGFIIFEYFPFLLLMPLGIFYLMFSTTMEMFED